MKKSEIVKLGYQYAYDCGSEQCTESVLQKIYELDILRDSAIKRKYRSTKSYNHYIYGDMKFNPFEAESKAFIYFNAGVLKAFTEMEAINKAQDKTIEWSCWYFDNEIDTSYQIRRAIDSMPAGTRRSRCEKLADDYDMGVQALMTLIQDELSGTSSIQFDALFVSDKKVLLERAK